MSNSLSFKLAFVRLHKTNLFQLVLEFIDWKFRNEKQKKLEDQFRFVLVNNFLSKYKYFTILVPVCYCYKILQIIYKKIYIYLKANFIFSNIYDKIS